MGHRSGCRQRLAEQGYPTVFPRPGSRGQGPHLDSEGIQPRGTCYHLSSAWGPHSPLLLLVFLCLVHHREAPAAEKGQVGSLDSPERPHSPSESLGQSPEAWARAGGRVQVLLWAQHIPAAASSSHSPASLPGPRLPHPPERSRHSQRVKGECQKPQPSDCSQQQ